MSLLRFQHALDVVVRQLTHCDYIVSNRLAVERRTFSGTIIIIRLIFVIRIDVNVKPRNHTVPTFATQGRKQQPPCRAALYTEGLSTAKLLPHDIFSFSALTPCNG